MFSMTGYGRAAVERDGRQLTIELKSVNHRYLDLSFRMPRGFAFLEDEARKRIAATVSRGHVDVFATYRNLREDARGVTLDPAMLLAYQRAFNEAAAVCDAPDDRALSRLLSMPDVLRVEELEEDREALRALLIETVDRALADLNAMRAREGAAMAADALGRASAIEALTGEIEARYPQTVADYERRLRERIEELLSAPVDEQRLLTEVAIMADRSAISEEIVRLKSHVSQLRKLLTETEPVGRKLDFLVQELNREVNTISSKSQDIPITQRVVAAKSEIEKLREQVQNIE